MESKGRLISDIMISIIKNKPSIIITDKCNNPPPYKCYPILGEALNSFYKKDKIIEDLEFWRLD